jgi:hypothetical protein
MSTELKGMMSEDEFLEHAGVKGMKWGKRKSESANTSRTSADAARVNKIKARVKKNGLDNLSNDDIAKLNKRKELVNAYAKNNPNAMKAGYKGVKDAVAVVGTLMAAGVLLTKFVKSPIVQKGAAAVKAAITNIGSIPVG